MNLASQWISARITSEGDKSIQAKLLDSLYFTLFDERYQNIREAHSKTFKWIFDDRPATMPPWTDVLGWLMSTDREKSVDWVTGKPCSGKSTLMRYLCDNPRTKLHLQTWATSQRLVTANCFFWAAGNAIQKSLIGLLRSLLHKLLSQCPEFLEKVVRSNLLSFLVQAGLRLSATAKLIENPSSIHKDGQHLLRYAVDREMEVTPGIIPPDVELIRLMLKLRADPNSGLVVSTWRILLSIVETEPRFRRIPEDTGPWKETTQLFILYGANKDEEVTPLPFQEWLGPQEGGRPEILLEEQNLIASRAEERTTPTKEG